MDARKSAESIFIKAIESVQPERLISENIKLNKSVLTVYGEDIRIADIENIYLLGAGKASGSMALAVESVLGSLITEGLVIVKYGHGASLRYSRIIEAGHPVPDKNSFEASIEIMRIAGKASEKDLVISLLSGGGSSLLADCQGDMTPSEIIQINDILLKCGADICEINTVRKHLSGIKGGRLAASVYPATLINLILSDVHGDLPDMIASGPFSPDPTTFRDAVEVIRKHGIESNMPASAMAFLMDGRNMIIEETPKPGNPIFGKVRNIITGSNRMAVDAAGKFAREIGFCSVGLKYDLSGEVVDAAGRVIADAVECLNDTSVSKPACLIYGGETTVKVTGEGSGGRNQHLALECALRLRDRCGITILAGGTDGNDGNTDAAGAVADYMTSIRAKELGIAPGRYQSEFDSHNFFKRAGGLLMTGPTLTNVMDLVIVIIENNRG